jgi:SPX domain protein involved in polyphosphate accumulation
MTDKSQMNQVSQGVAGKIEPLRPSHPAVAHKPTVKPAHPKKKKEIAAQLIKDTMLSCRYELKYRIREAKARAIAQYVQSYIAIDRYSLKSPNLKYPVSSLYFDSNNLHLAKETLNRKTNRFKLRVRCYDDNPETPCFVEIKRRLNSVVMKDRSRLSKDVLKKVVRDMHVPGDLYKKDQKTLRQFQFYLRTLCARPVVLVRYMRQAFEGDSRNRVRITFDRQLNFKTVDKPILEVNGGNWYNVPMDFVVLEIKFTNHYPLWLSDMVKVFDLKQTAMSKYVSSVKQSCSMGYCAPTCSVGM